MWIKASAKCLNANVVYIYTYIYLRKYQGIKIWYYHCTLILFVNVWQPGMNYDLRIILIGSIFIFSLYHLFCFDPSNQLHGLVRDFLPGGRLSKVYVDLRWGNVTKTRVNSAEQLCFSSTSTQIKEHFHDHQAVKWLLLCDLGVMKGTSIILFSHPDCTASVSSHRSDENKVWCLFPSTGIKYEIQYKRLRFK